MLPQILEVALGLMVVYYALGTIVSIVTQIVLESLEARGAALEKYLKRIAGDRMIDLTSLPQIRALRPVRYANWWNAFRAGTEEKRVEKIPAATLVDAFFDLIGLTARKDLKADELIALISQLPESEGKAALLNWINQGVTDINLLRARTHAYFSGLMDQAAAAFKANARSIVIVLSLVITLLFGTDSIQLAQDLWANAGLRAVAQAQALAVAQQPMPPTDLSTLIQQLSALSIRIGWWQYPPLVLPASPAEWAKLVLLKLAGLGITAVAVSQGSSFWYDVLRKLAGAKSPSKSALESEAEG